MKINNKKIDELSKTFLIAEVGLGHEGSLGIAKSFIEKAKINGADAIKFQMHIPEFESSSLENFRKISLLKIKLDMIIEENIFYTQRMEYT